MYYSLLTRHVSMCRAFYVIPRVVMLHFESVSEYGASAEVALSAAVVAGNTPLFSPVQVVDCVLVTERTPNTITKGWN